MVVAVGGWGSGRDQVHHGSGTPCSSTRRHWARQTPHCCSWGRASVSVAKLHAVASDEAHSSGPW